MQTKFSLILVFLSFVNFSNAQQFPTEMLQKLAAFQSKPFVQKAAQNRDVLPDCLPDSSLNFVLK